VGDDQGVEDLSVPWRFEGVLVEHPSYGRGRLVAEPNSGWFQFVPVRSGPTVAIPASKALSQVRVILPEEIADNELEDLDWASARWSPLADVDRALADEMASLVVGRVFVAGRLDHRWRAEALTQLQLHLGHTATGVRIIRAVLPLGASESLYEWDGTAATARSIALGIGESAGRAIVVERAAGSPCGWEPVDLRASRTD
jgi:hypothetical protein